MKTIKMLLGGKYVAEITEDGLSHLVESNHPFALNWNNLYDACFYGIHNSSTFEQRFELAKKGQYFCYMKPSLKLIAEED